MPIGRVEFLNPPVRDRRVSRELQADARGRAGAVRIDTA